MGTVAVPQLGKGSRVHLCPHPQAWMATLSSWKKKPSSVSCCPQLGCPLRIPHSSHLGLHCRGPLLPPVPAPTASSFLSLLRLQPTSPRGLLRMDMCLAVSSFGLGGVRNSGLEVSPLLVSSFRVCCQLQPLFWCFVTFPCAVLEGLVCPQSPQFDWLCTVGALTFLVRQHSETMSCSSGSCLADFSPLMPSDLWWLTVRRVVGLWSPGRSQAHYLLMPGQRAPSIPENTTCCEAGLHLLLTVSPASSSPPPPARGLGPRLGVSQHPAASLHVLKGLLLWVCVVLDH